MTHKTDKNAGNYIIAGFWVAIFMYMELIFHIFIYRKNDGNFLFPIIFGAVFGVINVIIIFNIPDKISRVFQHVLLIGTSLIFISQYIYYNIFKMFFSISAVGGAKNAMDFVSVLLSCILKNWYIIILFIIPYILFLFFKRKLQFNKEDRIRWNIYIVLILIALLILVAFKLDDDEGKRYSPKQLFYKKYVAELSMQKLGVFVTSARDIQALIETDSKRELTELTKNEFEKYEARTDKDGIARSPQIDEDIDFEYIYNSTDDYDIRVVSAMLGDTEPSYTNGYTGVFKDYNVVFVTAESLSKYAISEEITPTLYKIFNEGFVFTNFYNPLWYHSTVDGEYVNCLSQYPSQNEWSLEKSKDTYQPYALGNILNRAGYKSLGYHNYNSYFYDRTETHPNMGYTIFKAIGHGLDIPNHNDDYSDLECMEYAYNDLSKIEKFNMYFMSFSGHMPYDTNKYSIAVNREFVKEKIKKEDISDEVIGYISCQRELDKALEYLIDELEKDGKLDKTLFIVAPDHYPYGLTDSQYNELAGQNVSVDKFEKSLSCLGIWCSAMKEPIRIDKTCSSIDILPTVLNLLGVKYDSRLLAGKDILSDADPLVVFSDQSFVTDKVKYNAVEDSVEYLVPQTQIEDGYLDRMIKQVDDKMYLSEEILNTDYYSIIYENNQK